MSNVSAAQANIEAVIPHVKSVTIAGQLIEIRQFKVGQLPAVLRVCSPIQNVLSNREAPLDITRLFMLYADDCLALLALMARQPREWVDDLEMDEAIGLFSDLIGVNLDFFVQRVIPVLVQKMGDLTEAANTLKGGMNGQTAFSN